MSNKPNNLIMYFSKAGENYWAGDIISLEKGNSEQCAEYIQEAVGGELFEIATVKPYSDNYKACCNEAREETKNNARPELVAYIEDIEEFDNIFICGPCWCGTYPMAIFSQVEKLDFTGKKVMALLSHEGSGLARSERELKAACKGATFGEGIAIIGHQTKESKEEIAAWAKKQIKA